MKNVLYVENGALIVIVTHMGTQNKHTHTHPFPRGAHRYTYEHLPRQTAPAKIRNGYCLGFSLRLLCPFCGGIKRSAIRRANWAVGVFVCPPPRRSDKPRTTLCVGVRLTTRFTRLCISFACTQTAPRHFRCVCVYHQPIGSSPRMRPICCLYSPSLGFDT